MFPGPWEWIFILFVVLLLFGGKRLPELARSLGKGVKEFRKASQEISEELRSPGSDAEEEDSSVKKEDHAG